MPEEERQPDEYSFEEAMDSLESIVASLEGERLPLEEMVRSYEQGVKLLRVCRGRLETARQRVELITADLEGRGKATLSDFGALEAPESPAAPTSTSSQEEPARRSSSRKRPAPAEPPSPPSSGSGDSEGEIRLF